MTEPLPSPAAAAPSHFRAFARRPLNLPATVIAGGGSWQRSARLVDLGLGGACVSLEEAVPAGSRIALVIDAPHLWDPLEIDGVVAWTREDSTTALASLGVKFEHPAARTLRRIAELLATNLF